MVGSGDWNRKQLRRCFQRIINLDRVPKCSALVQESYMGVDRLIEIVSRKIDKPHHKLVGVTAVDDRSPGGGWFPDRREDHR